MKRTLLLGAAVCLLALAATPASASLTGAIFTTLPDGSEVNFNIYAAKEDVYLDGGPGNGAPQDAAGLPDGIYVFQITDPSGKKLLSQDEARCRQFTVESGIITGVVAQPDGCEHATGLDVDHGATTVQMMPYDNTPNPGGEYKAFATQVDAFLAGCALLGEDDGLNVRDCGWAGGNPHGFVAGDSKTDNFKVRASSNLEIDTTFVNDATGEKINGLRLTWVDTLGFSNQKFSYSSAKIGIDHLAHVEAVERGNHKILISSQPGCKVVSVHCNTGGCNFQSYGPATVPVTVKANDPIWTKNITVRCEVAP